MYTGLIHTHGLLRYAVLIMLIFTLVRSFMGNKDSMQKDRKIFAITMSVLHLQILVGIGLYMASDMVSGFLEQDGFMKNSGMRFWVVEHLVAMLIAAVLFTIGYSKFKKAEDVNKKYKLAKIFFTIAFIIIIFSIPWPWREGLISRGWMPGM